VFCGSSDRGPRAHRDAAVRLGRLLAAAEVELVFGGGRVGLMGILADAALGAGGRVVGVIPEHLLKAEVGHGKASELIVTADMHERKETMFARADAFAVLPGGPGTLDETFEILTWRQLGLHDKPVVVVDLDGYWKPFVGLVDHLVRQRYARPSFRRFFKVCDDVDAVLPTLARAPRPRRRTRLDRL
jgi:uncharacterized protein (TIGR00730 family)